MANYSHLNIALKARDQSLTTKQHHTPQLTSSFGQPKKNVCQTINMFISHTHMYIHTGMCDSTRHICHFQRRRQSEKKKIIIPALSPSDNTSGIWLVKRVDLRLITTLSDPLYITLMICDCVNVLYMFFVWIISKSCGELRSMTSSLMRGVATSRL